MTATVRTLRARFRGLAPSLLLVLVGAALLRITVGSDVFLQYVKEGLRLPLIASGVILAGLGVAGTVVRLTERRREPVLEFRRDAEGNAVWHVPHGGAGHAHDEHGHEAHDEHGHDGHGHGHGPRVAWLLAVPAVLLLCFAPPALGSFTASRDGADATVDTAAYTAALAAPPPAPA
ncbi:hypothetical protein AB0N76_18965, partial [Kitasatospora sp. NPDC093806]